MKLSTNTVCDHHVTLFGCQVEGHEGWLVRESTLVDFVVFLLDPHNKLKELQNATDSSCETGQQ